MGRADEYQFDYLEDNHRFADQVNGALFGGQQVVKPDELEPAEPQAVFLGKESGARENFKAIVDKARMWRGSLIHILAVENQLYVDYHMILRNMLSESLSYHRQWKKKKAHHDRKKDLPIGTDEFMSGMTKDEKFLPVITLVVYCGMEKSWDGAKCLHDLLDMDDRMKPYVTNYRLNLYDCHEHDTFHEYHTGLRQLFEVVRYGGNKEELARVIAENREAYTNIDNETRELIEVVAKVKIPEVCKVVKKGEERFDMCKAFEDYKLEGKQEGKLEGRQEYLVTLVCKKLKKGMEVSVIADELEESPEVIEKIVETQRKVGSFSVEEICTALMKDQTFSWNMALC